MKVLLLHAFPLDERMWEPQLESLRDYEVSTPRLYGRGESLDDWGASLLDEEDGELILVGACTDESHGANPRWLPVCHCESRVPAHRGTDEHELAFYLREHR